MSTAINVTQAIGEFESHAVPRQGSGRSLKALAVRGSVWTIVGYGASQILRLGSNLILTRLLFPEAFGLMALVSVFMQGLAMFSDVGIRPSIIQNERGDDRAFLNTAWTIQVIRGFVLWSCACLLAWPFATFYGEPQLALLIPVTGLVALIGGFNSTAFATAQRHLALGKLTILELFSHIVSIVVMISWAWLDPTVWALVAGGLAGVAVKLVLSHTWLAESRNRFGWDREAARSLFRFGKWIFLTTILTFLANQADRLILGRLVSLEMLGVYSIAFMLTGVPRQLLGRLGSGVIFPAVSRRAHLDREELRHKIVRHRWWPLLGMAGVVALLATFGDQVVLLLWDDRYSEASWMTAVLALGLWPTVLLNTLGPSLRSIGKPQYGTLGSSTRLIWVSIAMIAGFQMFGLFGALIALVFADVPKYFSILLGLYRERLLAWKQDIVATAIFALLVSLLLFGRSLLGMEMPFFAKL